jgi:uncharacterized protein YciI
MLFTVIYRPGRLWDPQRTAFEQDNIAAHRDFLAARLADKTLCAGGPFLDDAGGIAIYEYASGEHLEDLVGTDPTIIAGLMTYEIHPCIFPFVSEALGGFPE